jgi:hypothetical protein
MAAHSSKDSKKKGDSHSAEVRKELFKKLEPLSDKWISHLSESLLAVVPCSYCSVKKENGVITISAPKYDDANQCLKCHGRMVLPDQDQRNWAADEIGNRLAPAPKTIEEPEDDGKVFNEFAQSLEGKTDEEIRKIAESIGLTDVSKSSGS